MNQKTTILFDMYGVILEESKGNFIPYTFKHFPKEEHERLISQFKKEQLFTKAGNGDVKCRKPDKKIYELTLEKIGRTASECYFVDNSVQNLEAAAEIGVSPILFNRDNEEYAGTIINSFKEFETILKH